MKVQRISKDCIDVHYEVSANNPLKLFIHSDVHFDNPHCDRKLYFEHLDMAKKEGRKSLCFGDFFCLMQGKYDPRRSKSAIRPEHNVSNYLDAVINDTANKMSKYKDDFLIISEGNHESSIRRNCETDVLDRFIERLGGGIVRGKYQGWVRLMLHKNKQTAQRSLNLFYHHGKFGGIVTKGVLGVGRYGLIAPDADIIVTGHTHDKWVMEQPRFRLKANGDVKLESQLHIKTGTYKEEYLDGEGFATERIVMPKSIGGIFLDINLYGRDREIVYNMKLV